MKQLLLICTLIVLISFVNPAMSQDKPKSVEKKVMVIKSSDLEDDKTKNVWISDDGKSIKLDGEKAIFVAEEHDVKEVSVNVNTEMRDGNEVRTIEVTIKEGEEEKVIAWEDDGEIPEEVATMLEKEGIDVQMFDSENVTITVDATEQEAEDDQNINLDIQVEEENGVIHRTVEITIEEEDEVQKMKWMDDGETPAEIQEKLDALGIDLDQMGHGQHGEEVEIIIEREAESDMQEDEIGVEKRIIKIDLSDGVEVPAEIQEQLEEYDIDIDAIIQEAKDGSAGEQKMEKKIRIIKSDDHDNSDVDAKIIRLEEGQELPADMKQLLKDKGIEIDKLLKEVKREAKVSGKKAVKTRVKIIEGEDKSQVATDVKIINIKDGEVISEDVRQILKERGIDLKTIKSDNINLSEQDAKTHVIKIKDNEGNIKVMEWDGEGEMPKDMKKHMKKMEKEGHTLHEQHMKFKGNKKHSRNIEPDLQFNNKAILGVTPKNTSDIGVEVSNVIKGSAAERIGMQVGDKIKYVDGNDVFDIESLLSTLQHKEPGDDAEITFMRDGLTFRAVAELTAAEEDIIKEVEVTEIKEATCDTNSFTRDENVNMFFKSIIKGNDADQITNIIIINQMDSDAVEQEIEKEEVEIEVSDEKTVESMPIENFEVQDLPSIEKSKQLSLENFKAFPNPTSGFVNISFEGEPTPLVVQLSDISGRTIFKETLNNFSGSFNKDIDLSEAQKGQFILHVIQDQKVFAESIIVQ